MINPDLDSTGGDQGQSMKSKSIQSSDNITLVRFPELTLECLGIGNFELLNL